MKLKDTLQAAPLLAALITTGAFAQEATPQEQQLLDQMKQAARAQGMTITPEMEAQMLQRYRETSAGFMGLRMAVEAQKTQRAAPPSPAPVQSVAPSEPAVQAAATLQSAPAASTGNPGDIAATFLAHHQARGPATFEEAADGFKANGRLWMDPSGEIQTYGIDPQTGDVTYLVDAGGGRYTVKYANANASASPVTIGTMVIDEDRVTLNTLDGQQIGGESFVAMADGILVTRAGSMFRYVPGQQIASQTVPAGYSVMYAHGGDVAGTGYVLAMKRGKPTWRDAIGARPGQPVNTWSRSATRGLFGVSPSRVGLKQPTSFGSRDPDFALIEIATGRSVIVPRSELTTDLGWEDRDGNKQHFLNAIRWYPTTIGPIAIVGGDDNASIYAIHLPTGRQEILFKRLMGINHWRAEQTPDGSIRVLAQLGLRGGEVADVREKFGAAP
ncbi:MAG: hypothetical protein Q4F49_02375 [Pseudoxanthomonas suwonensis]|nr:hypothetical protein [Pseudoxanthomonas suwonensis]